MGDHGTNVIAASTGDGSHETKIFKARNKTETEARFHLDEA
jgi:hypothetical protein